MAKLNARGNRVLWRVRYTTVHKDTTYGDPFHGSATRRPNGQYVVVETTWLVAMRSDGRLLRRMTQSRRVDTDSTVRFNSGYKLWKKVRPGFTLTAADFARAVEQKGALDISIL